MAFERDALHIYAALLVQIAAAKLSRRSLGHVLPWLVVLGVELINEIFDIWRGGEPRLMSWQIVAAMHDVINTMLLPTALLILCRQAPGVFSWRNEAADNGDSSLRPGDERTEAAVENTVGRPIGPPTA